MLADGTVLPDVVGNMRCASSYPLVSHCAPPLFAIARDQRGNVTGAASIACAVRLVITIVSGALALDAVRERIEKASDAREQAKVHGPSSTRGGWE